MDHIRDEEINLFSFLVVTSHKVPHLFYSDLEPNTGPSRAKSTGEMINSMQVFGIFEDGEGLFPFHIYLIR